MKSVNLNQRGYGHLFGGKFVFLVVALLSLTFFAGFAQADENSTRQYNREVVEVKTSTAHQVNCNALPKYERFKCYEDSNKRIREAQAAAELEKKKLQEAQVKLVAIEARASLGDEIKSRCREFSGKERVLCVDRQVLQKRKAQVLTTGKKLENAYEKLAEDKAKAFRESVKKKFKSESEAKLALERHLKVYKNKILELKQLNDRIVLLRLKARLTVDEKVELARELDQAFLSSISARVSLARRLEAQGASSELADQIVNFLVAQADAYKSTKDLAEKKKIVLDTNEKWREFKLALAKGFFTGKVEERAFRIKSVLKKADATTAKLKEQGKDVALLEKISLRAHEHIEHSLSSRMTFKLAVWHLTRGQVWANFYLQSINRLVNGKSLDVEPNDEAAKQETSDDVVINTPESEAEQDSITIKTEGGNVIEVPLLPAPEANASSQVNASAETNAAINQSVNSTA